VKIAVVTGNPKPASRTHGVALAVARALAAARPGARTDPVADLAGHAPRLFDASDAGLSEHTDADAAVAAWAATAVPLIRGALAGYEASQA
jgi:FMN reductase